MYSLDSFSTEYVYQCSDANRLRGHYRSKLVFICALEQANKANNAKKIAITTVLILVLLSVLVSVALYIFFCGRREPVEDIDESEEGNPIDNPVTKAALIQQIIDE